MNMGNSKIKTAKELFEAAKAFADLSVKAGGIPNTPSMEDLFRNNTGDFGSIFDILKRSHGK